MRKTGDQQQPSRKSQQPQPQPTTTTPAPTPNPQPTTKKKATPPNPNPSPMAQNQEDDNELCLTQKGGGGGGDNDEESSSSSSSSEDEGNDASESDGDDEEEESDNTATGSGTTTTKGKKSPKKPSSGAPANAVKSSEVYFQFGLDCKDKSPLTQKSLHDLVGQLPASYPETGMHTDSIEPSSSSSYKAAISNRDKQNDYLELAPNGLPSLDRLTREVGKKVYAGIEHVVRNNKKKTVQTQHIFMFIEERMPQDFVTGITERVKKHVQELEKAKNVEASAIAAKVNAMMAERGIASEAAAAIIAAIGTGESGTRSGPTRIQKAKLVLPIGLWDYCRGVKKEIIDQTKTNETSTLTPTIPSGEVGEPAAETTTGGTKDSSTAVANPNTIPKKKKKKSGSSILRKSEGADIVFVALIQTIMEQALLHIRYSVPPFSNGDPNKNPNVLDLLDFEMGLSNFTPFTLSLGISVNHGAFPGVSTRLYASTYSLIQAYGKAGFLEVTPIEEGSTRVNITKQNSHYRHGGSLPCINTARAIVPSGLVHVRGGHLRGSASGANEAKTKLVSTGRLLKKQVYSTKNANGETGGEGEGGGGGSKKRGKKRRASEPNTPTNGGSGETGATTTTTGGGRNDQGDTEDDGGALQKRSGKKAKKHHRERERDSESTSQPIAVTN